MKEGNLPTENAEVPEEEACLTQQSQRSTDAMMKSKLTVTFAEDTPCSQNSTTYSTDVLSQPAPEISQRQRLIWLQERRTGGLWVQCDDCQKWRFLDNVIDRHQLPAKWLCTMNPDKSAADCSVPEKPLHIRESEDLIDGEYYTGSVVWARLNGWPWWPAMVDDCPDIEQYYWLNGFSDVPTHYNVVFFDTIDVTRAWIASGNLQPFRANKKLHKELPKPKGQRMRLEAAIKQADDADMLPLRERLAKYSFISRYQGPINKPYEITKNDLKRFQNRLKKKYHVEFPEESPSEGENDNRTKQKKTTAVKKDRNVLIGGTRNSKQKKNALNMQSRGKSVAADSQATKCDTNSTEKSPFEGENDNRTKQKKTTAGKNERNVLIVGTPNSKQKKNPRNMQGRRNTVVANSQATKCDTENNAQGTLQETVINSENDTFKQPNSLLVQVGSTVTSTVLDVSYDNDTSATYVPENEIESDIIKYAVQESTERAVSISSNDFEF